MFLAAPEEVQQLFLVAFAQCQWLSGWHWLAASYSKLPDVIRREICRVGFDPRNPKPETDSDQRLGFLRIGRNPKPETQNRLLKLVSNYETRNPKPETDY